ncbi:hypothetical protein [Luteitalea sp.]
MAIAKTPRRKKPAERSPEPPIGGMPVELLGVRLIGAQVSLDLDGIEEHGDHVQGFLDTETELTIRKDALWAVLQLRCRIATPDRSRVLFDATLRHRLDYAFRGEASAAGERLARRNALFAVWPYWRALLADISARAGVKTMSLPLLSGGSDKLTSNFDLRGAER